MGQAGVRSQESGVRSQESGVRSQESGVRSQEKEHFLVFSFGFLVKREGMHDTRRGKIEDRGWTMAKPGRENSFQF